MKILIGGSSSKIFHLNEFAKELINLGIQTKVVFDTDFSDGFPSRKIKYWIKPKNTFKKLVNEFKPDIILVDRQRHFALDAINEKIPVIIHLRGNYWKEMKTASETIYKSLPKKIALNAWKKMGERCFNEAEIIVPICNYLDKITKEKILNKKTFVMHQGIDPLNWYNVEGMKLEHPCVGLLQGAVIWDKTKELLILENVLKRLPNVKFYWVGEGPFRKEIMIRLKKYKNFEWLGPLEYPNKVREYLSEIDIYALISGLDMSPLTLLEAQLMKKPVIATNVGGIPELMVDKKTGFLIKKGNPEELISKIEELLNDPKKIEVMGIEGRKFVENNFSWKIITQKFIDNLKKILNE
ncbi:glycosyltransferase family 4 protein [Nitrosopumilus sp.]|nr:glycosyltransferase family 4 protein [Nitrosopumilus sp.]